MKNSIVNVRFLKMNKYTERLTLVSKMKYMNERSWLSQNEYPYFNTRDKNLKIGDFVIVRNGIPGDNSPVQLGIVTSYYKDDPEFLDYANPILSTFPSVNVIADRVLLARNKRDSFERNDFFDRNGNDSDINKRKDKKQLRHFKLLARNSQEAREVLTDLGILSKEEL